MLFTSSLLQGATVAPVTLKDFGQPELLDRNMAPASLYHLEFDNQILPILSVDDADPARAGGSWTAIITPLTDLTSAYHSHSQLSYEEAAWLYAQDLQPSADRSASSTRPGRFSTPAFSWTPFRFFGLPLLS